MKNHENQPKNMKNHGPPESDHFSLLTYMGSQLTFMTQNEKVMIVRYLLIRGPN